MIYTNAMKQGLKLLSLTTKKRSSTGRIFHLEWLVLYRTKARWIWLQEIQCTTKCWWGTSASTQLLSYMGDHKFSSKTVRLGMSRYGLCSTWHITHTAVAVLQSDYATHQVWATFRLLLEACLYSLTLLATEFTMLISNLNNLEVGCLSAKWGSSVK